MNRLLDPFDSLGPVRKELLAHYAAVLGLFLVFAEATLYIGSPIFILGFLVSNLFDATKKTKSRLGIEPAANAKWRDAGVMWLFGAGFAIVAVAAVPGYLLLMSETKPRMYGFSLSHVPFAVATALISPLVVAINLRRLSFLAAHSAGQLAEAVTQA